MGDSKRKERDKPVLRQPGPKGLPELKIRPALSLPHDDLIPDLGVRRPEVPSPSDQSIPDTGSPVTPVSDSNRSTIDTGSAATPVSNEPVLKLTPVSHTNRSAGDTGVTGKLVAEANQYQELQTHYFKVPNEVADRIMGLIDDEEFKLYFRLFRLSHGYRQTTCFVGYTALAQACKMSLSKVKRVLPRLVSLGLVRVVRVYNGPEKKGTLYEIRTGPSVTPVPEMDRSMSATGVTGEPNKHDHDDHDSLNPNHHQSEVMKIYQELTGKSWTKGDRSQYKKVAGLELGQVEVLMRLVHARAGEPIGSFAYFASSILKELTPAGQQSRALLRKKYEAYAKELAAVHLGSERPPSERAADPKIKCLREGTQ